MQANPIQSAVATILDASAHRNAPSFSEAEFVHLVVEDFANKGLLSGPLAQIVEFSGAADEHAEDGVKVQTLRHEPHPLVTLRQLFRMDLERIVDGKFEKHFRPSIYRAADRVVLVPITNKDKSVSFQVFPENLDALIALALKWIVAGPYADDLKQCQLEQCSQFFFVSVRRQKYGQETGRSPDRYCSPEHMTVAHIERATAATFRRRQRIKMEREAKRIAVAKRKQEKQL